MLNYSPTRKVSWEAKDAVKVLLAFSVVLYAVSVGRYFVGGFAWVYLISTNLSGIIMVYATSRLVISSVSGNIWRLYRLSAFTYLGLIFFAICLDIWLWQ